MNKFTLVLLVFLKSHFIFSQYLQVDTTFNSGNGFNATDLAGAPRAIGVQSTGKIIVAGQFSKYNDSIAPGIVRLHKNGILDTSFNTQLTGIYDISDLIVTKNDEILIAGTFDNLGNNKFRGIARLLSNGEVDQSFKAIGLPITGGTVNDIHLDAKNRILVAGYFDSFNNIKCGSFCRLNSDGTTDTSLLYDSNKDWISSCYSLKNECILLGRISSTPVKIKNNGVMDTTFKFNQNISVYQFTELYNEEIIIGGSVFMKVDQMGNMDTNFCKNQPNGNCFSFVRLNNGNYILVGWFTDANAPRINPIIFLNHIGDQIDSLNFILSDFGTRIIKYDNNSILVTGRFGTVNNGYKQVKISRFFLKDALLSFQPTSTFKTSIYPNPSTHGILKFKGEIPYKVSIYNQSGQRVLQESTIFNDSISISKLTSGLYCITLEYKSGKNMSTNLIVE